MPTKKPRLFITITPRTFEALRAWGEAEGVSAPIKAGVFLDECTPALEGLAKVAQAGKKNIYKALEALTEMTDSATVMSGDMQRELAGLRHRSRKGAKATK